MDSTNKKMADEQVYGIYVIGSCNPFYGWITARSEYEALKKFRSSRELPSCFHLIKGEKHWSLFTRFTEFYAVKKAR